MNGIKESDWKHLRKLTPTALDRFCSRVLSEVERTSLNPAATFHERYLKVVGLIQEQDKELGRMFDDLKRSNAMTKLFLMRSASLLTEEEWAGFSEEIRSMFTRMQGL